ncbi:MAG: UDP-galactopyranose mutase [Verrucomicrobiae bacterium]|nr:UDP-galactopyranose mutase [Verrucomicrobiae bacterium]
MKYDFLIVGAGFSGLVLGERLSNELGKTCLVIDRRNHIGGNAYDEHDAAGVLVHRYGPHYFRTNSRKVIDYLSRFTEWHHVDYKVLSFTEGRYWSFPVNLRTFEQMLGRASTTGEFEAYLAGKREKIDAPQNSEEVIVSQVGWELYEKFFKNYTLKQWRRHPRELDASVCGRIPLRTNRDDRYLSEGFQALPKEGYTALFRKMIAASPRMTVRLGACFQEIKKAVEYGFLIFTGPIDEYFDYCLGRLPYRSLRFEPETHGAEELKKRESVSGKKGFWQPEMQVNYPDPDVPYTRTVEIKHATGQECDNTTVVREYPEEYGPGREAYYPVPTQESAALYREYEQLASKENDVLFTGRLGTYRYYNMDQVVAMALTQFEKLRMRFP